ncbi:hypothetical protein PISMIDRAFT_242074 [Pisolithus microcarpus 441]|uniref:Uncharacterized protein n=1 Tax=Pisolithus microcarpus 441 TaxID=765257 RepID=A0A0D0A3M8_9AGAM|nr:hypothetical protein PISMIDRAFT_242074 [Pisolithus microcarpus 441]
MMAWHRACYANIRKSGCGKRICQFTRLDVRSLPGLPAVHVWLRPAFKLLLGINQRGDELKVPRVLWRIVPRSAVPGCLKKTLALKQSCLPETGVALTTSAVPQLRGRDGLDSEQERLVKNTQISRLPHDRLPEQGR